MKSIDRKYFFIILVVIGCIIISNKQMVDLIQSRIVTAFNINDYSTADRIVLMKAAIDSIKLNPIFGNGIRSFALIVKSGEYQIWSSVVFQPHNAYLELFQSLGIIGLGLFGLIIFFSLYKKRNSRYRVIIIMFFVIGLLNRIFNEFSTTILFWTILSFV